MLLGETRGTRPLTPATFLGSSSSNTVPGEGGILLESVRNARSGKGLGTLIKQPAREVAAPQVFNRPSLRGSRNSTSVIPSRPHAVRKHVESDLARGKSIEGPLIGGTQFSSAIVIAHPNSSLETSPEAPFPSPLGQRSQEACPPLRPSRESTRCCPRRSGSHTGRHEEPQKKGGETYPEDDNTL